MDDAAIAKTDHDGSGEELSASNVEMDDETTTGNQSIDAQSISVLENVLYQQISDQILKMMATTYKYEESNEDMAFDLDHQNKTLQVSKVRADGSCLFRALAHQLFAEKLYTSAQDQSTKKLRADVVAHIKRNFEDFEHELKGCVLDRKQSSEVHDLDKECKLYLNYCLTKSGCWGGAESIKAVSRMHQVNVVIINENGPCYLVNGFNANYGRSVLLAYRLANTDSPSQNIFRNHYDSVINIQQKDIFQCMKSMMKVIVKSFFGDEEENIVVED